MRLLATPFLSLLAGLVAGYALFRQPLSREVAGARPALSTTTRPVAQPPDSPETSRLKTDRLMATAIRKGAQIDRYAAIFLALEALSAEDFHRIAEDPDATKAMFEGLRSLDRDTRRELVSALVIRWLAVDEAAVPNWVPRMLQLIPPGDRTVALEVLADKHPQELLALASSWSDRAERADLISTALESISAQDPAQAQAWLHACTDPEERRVAERAIRTGLIRADPSRAIELARQCGNHYEGSQLLRQAATQAMKMGANEVRRLMAAPAEAWMSSAVLDILSEREPEECATLSLQSLAREHSSEMVYALRSSFFWLAERDLDLAMAKLAEVDPQHRPFAAMEISRQWAAKDPEAAVQWLAKMPAAERVDPLNVTYGSRDALWMTYGEWAACNQEAAERWAAALPAGETRDQAYAQLSRVLSIRGDDAGAIEAFAQAGQCSDPETIENIVRSWTVKDPEAAAEWAVAQAVGPAQNRALASVIGNWGNENSAAVETWLTQFPRGAAKDASVLAFLGRSSSQNADAEFEHWFPQIEDPWSRTRAALRHFWKLHGRAPGAAREWLQSVDQIDSAAVRMTLLGAGDSPER